MSKTYKLLNQHHNWVIDKEFHFEMGHRVHSQVLKDAKYCISTQCMCRHLHGHSYVIKVFLGATELDSSAMVTDFKNINFMKEFVDNKLDHKFMIDINDPNFEQITGCSTLTNCTNFESLSDRLPTHPDPNFQLHVDSFVLVDFVPTSENICKHIYEYAADFLNNAFDGVDVTAVELWETKKSHCRYEP